MCDEICMYNIIFLVQILSRKPIKKTSSPYQEKRKNETQTRLMKNDDK